MDDTKNSAPPQNNIPNIATSREENSDAIKVTGKVKIVEDDNKNDVEIGVFRAGRRSNGAPIPSNRPNPPISNNRPTITRRSTISSVNLTHIRSELNALSDLALTSPTCPPQEIDEEILQITLDNIGSRGYGLQGVSLWLFNDVNDRLEPKGWWRNPSMPPSIALERLFDPSRTDYVPEEPVLPGTDLAGLLWMESSEKDTVGGRRGGGSTVTDNLSLSLSRSTGAKMRRSLFANATIRKSRVSLPSASLRLSTPTGGKSERVSVKWRCIQSLVRDPDTAKGPRLELLDRAGFYRATGVPFKNDICRGIVIYYIKKGLDQDTLDGLANTSYMEQSAIMIGSCVSVITTRRATAGHKLRRGLSTHHETQHETDASSEQEATVNRRCPLIPHGIRKLATKMKGGGMQIPPPPNYVHTMWTTLGAFCGLLTMSSLNEAFRHMYDDELFLALGPFGALVTLQYALIAAPASQPRNAVLGQAVCGAVSLSFTYIPESALPVWIRVALAPAVAIGVMVKCGLTHPPAGALAVLVASGRFNWPLYALVIFSTVVSLIPATIINNLSHKRQYPSYWGFVLPEFIGDLLPDLFTRAFDKEEHESTIVYHEDPASKPSTADFTHLNTVPIKSAKVNGQND